MIMSSLLFLYFFLPLFIGLYAFVPAKHKAKMLILGEGVFLGWRSLYALIPFAGSMLLAYLLGMTIDNLRFKKRSQGAVLVIALTIELTMLGLAVYSMLGFKGAGTISRLFPPLGVFVYTLAAMSYYLDIYKGVIRCDHRFSLVAAFVGFFPCLTAGPLMRYGEVSQQFSAPQMSIEKTNDGISLYLKGLAEKCIISCTMGEMWGQLTKIDIDSVSAVTAWFGVICAGLYVYFEFASISHMARGVSLMLGIELPVNFDHPFKSVSATEFIGKFNVSVTSWFRSYIYDPVNALGGRLFMVLGIILTGTAMSLWYGTSLSRLMFGMYIAVLCIAELLFAGRVLKKLPYVVAMVINMLLIHLAMVFFVSEDCSYAFSFILAMFGKNGMLIDNLTLHFFENYAVIMITGLLITTGVFDLAYKRLGRSRHSFIPFLRPLWQLMLLILSTAFMTGRVQDFSGLLAL